MSREHHAGPVLGADRCPQRCLLPAIIQNPAPGNSERSEIFFDIGDQWQVRPVAHGIESDEVREQFADSFGSVVGHDLDHSTAVEIETIAGAILPRSAGGLHRSFFRFCCSSSWVRSSEYCD